MASNDRGRSRGAGAAGRARASSSARPRRARLLAVGGALIAIVAAVLVARSPKPVEPVAGVPAQARAAQTPVYGYQVITSYPHDPDAFTQGLIYRDGFLFESTGLNGRSSLRKVELDTGRVVKQQAVERQYFAEGLTEWGATLLQLTWETNLGFVYDRESFARQGTFRYDGEGWGLTHDDRRLIMSDGTSALRFLDPETRREIGRVQVHDGAQPIDHLNELELVRGEVYANVWLTDRIAVIDPSDGHVTGWLDLTGLQPKEVGDPGNAVLNGIAYDAAGDRLFVTGKLWPKLFEIRVKR